MDVDGLLYKIETLDGLTSDDVCRALCRYATTVPDHRTIVELGAYHGKSTAALAVGALAGQGPAVYTVDTWSEDVSGWRSSVADRIRSPRYETFEKQLRSLKVDSRGGIFDTVNVYRGNTVDAARLYRQELSDGEAIPVGLLFVDSDHRYPAVRADVEAWRPCVDKGSVVIFDDYNKNNPGVVRYVRELREAGAIKPVTRGPGSLVISTFTDRALPS